MAALIAWRRWSLGTSARHKHSRHQLSDFPHTWQVRIPKQTSASNTEQALAESILKINKEEIMGCHGRHYPQVFPALWGR